MHIASIGIDLGIGIACDEPRGGNGTLHEILFGTPCVEPARSGAFVSRLFPPLRQIKKDNVAVAFVGVGPGLPRSAQRGGGYAPARTRPSAVHVITSRAFSPIGIVPQTEKQKVKRTPTKP